MQLKIVFHLMDLSQNFTSSSLFLINFQFFIDPKYSYRNCSTKDYYKNNVAAHFLDSCHTGRVSESYLPDFVLQGTVTKNFTADLSSDLRLAVQVCEQTHYSRLHSYRMYSYQVQVQVQVY